MAFSDFLQAMLEPLAMGARSTADAFQEDVDAISAGRLPPQAMKAGGQILSHMASPSVNPTIPALQYARKAFDPQRGWYTVEEKMYPGGDWLQMMMRTGGFGGFLESIIKAMEGPRP